MAALISTLREDLHEYLEMRRALGFQLDKLERLAGGFIDSLATAQIESTSLTGESRTSRTIGSTRTCPEPVAWDPARRKRSA